MIVRITCLTKTDFILKDNWIFDIMFYESSSIYAHELSLHEQEVMKKPQEIFFSFICFLGVGCFVVGCRWMSDD
jgi:hypothetical protein